MPPKNYFQVKKHRKLKNKSETRKKIADEYNADSEGSSTSSVINLNPNSDLDLTPENTNKDVHLLSENLSLNMSISSNDATENNRVRN